jgi:hypothetical protein
MDRKIVVTGLLLTGLLVAMPALAQGFIPENIQWTSARPDGHAPAGVKTDFTLGGGELCVGYRYSPEKFRGTLPGTQEISDVEVLDFFTVALLTHDRWTGELDVRFGLGITTVEASVPWVRNEILNETATGFFESRSEFIGDISIRGLFDILEGDEYRLNLTLGATGKISKRGTTATLPRGGVVPFTMQGGSGRPDILAGGTFQVQNNIASIGAQANSVIRVKNNKNGHRLGDQFSFSVWSACNLSNWIIGSLIGPYEQRSRSDLSFTSATV